MGLSDASKASSDELDFQALCSRVWGEGDEDDLSRFSFSAAQAVLDEVRPAPVLPLCRHSKLAFLPDKGGKTRVVALGDILTQSLMRDIHRSLFSILRRLTTDGTFDQNKQRERVRECTKHHQKVYSIDMTACTDRLPAVYIMLVLKIIGLLSKRQALL